MMIALLFFVAVYDVYCVYDGVDFYVPVEIVDV